jgi:hypothetical protein
MAAFVPGKLTRQPSQVPQLNRANPLTQGISVAQVLGATRQYDAASNKLSVSVGTKTVPYSGGVASGFGSTVGVGTTDKVATPLALAITNRSYYFRAMRRAGGGGGLGRLFDKTNGGTGQILYVNDSTGNIVSSTYIGSVEITHTATAPATGTWFDVVVTVATTSTTTTTQIYLNGVPVLDTTSTPGGSRNDAASTVLTIGNRASDNARNWDGLIAFAVVWERLLTPAEARAVASNPWQLFQPAQPKLYLVPTASGSDTPVNPGVGAITVTGYAPTIAQPHGVAPGVGAITVTGYAPTVSQPHAVAPGVGAITVTGFTPTVARTANQFITPGVGSVTVAGYAPTVARTAHQSVTPGLGSVTVAGYAPTVARTAGQAVNPGVGAVVVTGYAPSIAQPKTVTPGLGAITVTGHAPTVAQRVNTDVAPGVGAVTVTGFAPTAARTAHQLVDPGVGSIIIAGQAPTVARTDHQSITPGLGAISITGHAPTVSQDSDDDSARMLYTVAAESRTFTVPAEPRNYTVAAEPRTYTIAAENRMYTVT